MRYSKKLQFPLATLLTAVMMASQPTLAASPSSSTGAQSSGKQLPQEQTIGKVESVFEFYGPMPTGVTVSDDGRIFVNFPRWGDDVTATVAELKDGKVVPYPNAAINEADKSRPGESLISVQSVVMDKQNRLWILDTAAPGFSEPVSGGAKLVAVDLATDQVVKTLVLPADAALPTTYLNDVRFDLEAGEEGIAYITDSSVKGPGAIIVVDLASGKAMRRLSGAVSTSPDPDFVPVVEGERMMNRTPDSSTSPFAVAADGIALPSDGSVLYFSPLSSRHLYSIPTASLRDETLSNDQLIAQVKDLGEKGASDGLDSGPDGAIYASDYEHNAIRKLTPGGDWETIAHDPRMLWPDTLSVAADGYLYFTANQLHRQPGFHGGKDLREKPYSLLRIKLSATETD